MHRPMPAAAAVHCVNVVIVIYVKYVSKSHATSPRWCIMSSVII